MKNLTIILFAILIVTSCNIYEFEEYGPIKSVIGLDESLYSDKSPNFIIKEGTDQQSNYYYQYEKVDSTKVFLVSCNNIDDNEIISPVLWNDTGNYFSIYISNSNRYEKGERLILYRVTKSKATKILDIRDRKINKYFFIGNYFELVYFENSDTISIKL